MIARRQYGLQKPFSQQNLVACQSILSSVPSSVQTRKNARFAHTQKLTNPSKPNPIAEEIAVLGGGITGLASAFFLTKELPNAKITIIEKRSRLGGWLESPLYEYDNGHVVFENGPRTLRQSLWSGHYLREMIEQLDIGHEIVTVPKSAPAASNRYIYYPDHMVRMPGPIPGAGVIRNLATNLTTLLREPIFDSVLPGLYAEATDNRISKRSSQVQDESLGDFITRRFGSSLADNIASAVIHGIYAGDLYKLSARTLLPMLWYLDGREESIISSIFKTSVMTKQQLLPRRLVELIQSTWDEKKPFRAYLRGNLAMLNGSSVFTFKDGLQQLTEALEVALRANPRVTIKTSTAIQEIQTSSNGEAGLHLSATSNKTNQPVEISSPDYIISSLPAPTMSQILSSSFPTASKAFSAHDSAVNVMVVNLFFKQENLVPVHGFGYLIPRSIPFEQNPECALGVIFGSDSSVGQDTARGTKLTVMLGGHWWDDLPMSDLPDSDSAIQMARTILARHLGITAQPVIARAVLQQNAIPQYTVGHHERLHNIHNALTAPNAPSGQGRIKLAGAWYAGIGVNDCVTAARQAVDNICHARDDRSGLEDFFDEQWAVEDRASGFIHMHGDYSKAMLDTIEAMKEARARSFKK